MMVCPLNAEPESRGFSVFLLRSRSFNSLNLFEIARQDYEL